MLSILSLNAWIFLGLNSFSSSVVGIGRECRLIKSGHSSETCLFCCRQRLNVLKKILSKNRVIINGFSLEPLKLERILPLAKEYNVDIVGFLLYPGRRVLKDETLFSWEMVSGKCNTNMDADEKET